MLPAAHRLRTSSDFAIAVRRGRRAARGALVLHLRVPAPGGARPVDSGPDLTPPAGSHQPPPRVGLVVGRAVGPAVVRNTIKRRLRHLMRSRLGSLPAGSLLVVRALPSAATQTPAALAADLEGALRRVLAAQPAGDQTAGRRTAGSRGAS